MSEQTLGALPKSAVSHTRAWLSLALVIAVLFAFRQWRSTDVMGCLAALVAAVALPHMLEQAPLILGLLKTGNAFSAKRIAFKLLGLVALYSVVVLAFLVFRGFSREFLQPLAAIPVAWIVGLVLATPFYIALTDRVMQDPDDALATLGRNVLGIEAVETNRSLQQFLLSWLVKAFFAPLMIVFATYGMPEVLTQDYLAKLSEPGGWYEVSYQFMFFIDVVFGTAGYLCTFKLFDAHIRSAEPALLGWLVCIICYPPFWNTVSNSFFNYGGEPGWGFWLADWPVLYALWGSAILACVAVYLWATISFGMRFSNLTHRGILTNGPYRYLKHPAYLSKNLSWWLVSVPFLSAEGSWQSFLNCLALLMVNGIYYLRAVTEERHLSRDPTYLAYVAWINEHGLLARVKSVMFKARHA